jgi:hypothetical protein
LSAVQALRLQSQADCSRFFLPAFRPCCLKDELFDCIRTIDDLLITIGVRLTKHCGAVGVALQACKNNSRARGVFCRLVLKQLQTTKKHFINSASEFTYQYIDALA